MLPNTNTQKSPLFFRTYNRVQGKLREDMWQSFSVAMQVSGIVSVTKNSKTG